MIHDVGGLIEGSAKLLTKAACDDPPQPPQGLFDDPILQRRDRMWYWLLRTFIGLMLVGVIAFAAWLYWAFS